MLTLVGWMPRGPRRRRRSPPGLPAAGPWPPGLGPLEARGPELSATFGAISGPVGMAVVTKIRLPHTMGVEDPLPRISTFHLTFLSSAHSRGGFPWGATPFAWGPRHWGQFFSSAGVGPPNHAMARADARKINEMETAIFFIVSPKPVEDSWILVAEIVFYLTVSGWANDLPKKRG